DARSQDYSHAIRVDALPRQSAVLHGQAGSRDAKPHGPAHDFQALAVLAGNKRAHVKLRNLGRDTDRMTGGIKAANSPNTAASLDAGLPESFLAHTIWGNHPETRDHHPAHGPASFALKKDEGISSSWTGPGGELSLSRAIRKRNAVIGKNVFWPQA